MLLDGSGEGETAEVLLLDEGSGLGEEKLLNGEELRATAKPAATRATNIRIAKSHFFASFIPCHLNWSVLVFFVVEEANLLIDRALCVGVILGLRFQV